MKLTLRKVIIFPEIAMGQYVVILKTCKFWNLLMWLTVALIKKKLFSHILATIFYHIYIYINPVTRLSLKVVIYSLFLYVQTCWIGSLKFLVLLRLMGLKLECVMSQNGHKLCIQCCKIFKVCLTILGHSLKG